MIEILSKIGPPGPLLSDFGPVLGKVWGDFTTGSQQAVADPSLALKTEALLPLALELARPYDSEQAIKAALRKLLRAVVKFDPKYNVPLEVYARIVIQRGLKEWHATREKRQASVFTSLTDRSNTVVSVQGQRILKRCQPGDLAGLDASLKIPLFRQIKDVVSPNEFTVFELFHFEGQRIGAIAHFMKVPEGTVKCWLFRGRRKIRKLRDFRATLLAAQEDQFPAPEDQLDNETIDD